MLCYRRMLKFKQVNRITNQEVLDGIRKKGTLWKNQEKRRAQMIGDSEDCLDILYGEKGRK